MLVRSNPAILFCLSFLNQHEPIASYEDALETLAPTDRCPPSTVRRSLRESRDACGAWQVKVVVTRGLKLDVKARDLLSVCFNDMHLITPVQEKTHMLKLSPCDQIHSHCGTP